MTLARLSQDGIERLTLKIGIRLYGGESFKDLLWCEVLRPIRNPPSKQSGQKLDAVAGKLEECLVDQMQEHVLPADIDDECHLRLERRDIGEVLIWANTQVHASRADLLL